ncbi:hypothetical protein WOLCODRAFT_149281 [Wolfiporia cocos MD-104 SS10]|uniref:Uncharacterized protein n=1 Tax=Wolfiporia cocos (strain MD-104) TaxID=742152 RepID=A0A2H3J7U3_WOLCO|nr:hypothetical protein WOLCODRAFT_149281 [Wolfiporia cocos MD-104 SS10]
MNAQLAALHDNAIACVRDHDTTHKPAEDTKYSHALAQYSYTEPYSKGQYGTFHATFDKPHIMFICNHDAILHLKIRTCQYHLDYTKPATSSYLARDRIQNLEDLELAYRIPFDMRRITGKDSMIGIEQNLIQLVVFNMTNARFLSMTPTLLNDRESLMYYISKYLAFLQQAGNHVLFSLPDFDDDRHRLTIDYTLLGTHEHSVDEIHGIRVDNINTYLSSVWLKASMLAQGEGVACNTRDWQSTCLAEFCSSWSSSSSGSHFHLTLGPPQIRPICSREAILYFAIDKVEFFRDADDQDEDGELVTAYNDLKIAFLVDLIHEVEADGHITRCRIDMTTVQIFPQYCEFADLDEELESRERLVQFFSHDYLDILEDIDFHIIYFFDARWAGALLTPEGPEYGIDSASTVDGQSPSGWCAETIEPASAYGDTGGFDHIMTVALSTINEHFRQLVESASASANSDYSALVQWTYGAEYHSRFKPLEIRLLSNGRAIVWVRLEAGWLKASSSVDGEYQFGACQIAFEVALKKGAHDELDVFEAFSKRYRKSLVWKEHGDRDDRTLEHIYLDVRNAEFLHELSSFDGFSQEHDHVLRIRKIRTVVQNLKNHYLPHLADHGLHILHTVPVYKAICSLSPSALTSIGWHVHSRGEITRHTWSHVSPSMEPSIVIFGNTGSQPLPTTTLGWSWSRIVRSFNSKSYGTISVASSVFLEERLLKQLSRVNAETTVIPLFTGIGDGKWQLQLTTWAEHEWRKSSVCKWTVVEECSNMKQYMWQHGDVWNYIHEGGNDDVSNGTYTVSCTTHNDILLPIASRHRSPKIEIRGVVELKLTYKIGFQSGSATSMARWDASLSLRSDPTHGIKVDVLGALVPRVDPTTYDGDMPPIEFPNPQAYLTQHLPAKVNIDAVLQELREFEGVWQHAYMGTQAYVLAHPVFGAKGDIIFELRPRAPPTTGRAVIAGRNGRNGIQRGMK